MTQHFYVKRFYRSNCDEFIMHDCSASISIRVESALWTSLNVFDPKWFINTVFLVPDKFSL